ncbi:MAG: glycoside hydrolase family 3 protein, partial [Lachnospiraceae bacterium]|nr:glycoside hydrolase family 3 protein [Lachnospiraceae bacterium]
MTTAIYPPLTAREIKGAELSRNAAREGMVLLKNDHEALPLSPGRIALFGNGAVRTVRGGTGSGDPFNGGLSGGGDFFINQSPRYHINILPALKEAGFEILTEELLETHAAAYDDAMQHNITSHMQVFAFPEAVLTEDILAPLSADTDTAVFVLSRNSGEGVDRKLEDDYNLSQIEKDDLKLIRKYFKKVVLVLNVAGPVAVKDLDEASPDAILVMGQAGQEGGIAVTDVLTGTVTPSGKLTTTWAKTYEDYPSSDVFLSDFDTSLYTEGIYVGYRYFRTFGKEAGYPFGYGLSYTSFVLTDLNACIEGVTLKAQARVRNTGSRSGREVVQLYISAPSTELDMPALELKGFKKTGVLAPGETETVTISVPLSALASYSEAASAYILSKGFYIVRLGTSSADTVPAAAIKIDETVKTKLVYEELPLKQELTVMSGLTGKDNADEAASLPLLVPENLPETEDARSPYQKPAVKTYTTDPQYEAVLDYETVVRVDAKPVTLKDVFTGKATYGELLAQLTEEQLADLACGTGWGVEDDANPVIGGSSESVPGAAGETTHALTETFGIPSIVVADGPGGVRLTQQFTAKNLETGEDQTVYHHCIAWPVGTLIAQSFDPEVAYQVGVGMKADLEAFRIDILVGPGINIHRNPLCGRNFEYVSEDP